MGRGIKNKTKEGGTMFEWLMKTIKETKRDLQGCGVDVDEVIIATIAVRILVGLLEEGEKKERRNDEKI